MSESTDDTIEKPAPPRMSEERMAWEALSPERRAKWKAWMEKQPPRPPGYVSPRPRLDALELDISEMAKRFEAALARPFVRGVAPAAPAAPVKPKKKVRPRTDTSSFNLVETADELRVSKRFLQYWLADHPVDAAGVPFYIPKGSHKTFDKSDIARIKAAMREEEQCRLRSINVKGSGITGEQLGQLVSAADSGVPVKPKIKISPRAKLPRWKPGTGKVISMVRKRS